MDDFSFHLFQCNRHALDLCARPNLSTAAFFHCDCRTDFKSTCVDVVQALWFTDIILASYQDLQQTRPKDDRIAKIFICALRMHQSSFRLLWTKSDSSQETYSTSSTMWKERVGREQNLLQTEFKLRRTTHSLFQNRHFILNGGALIAFLNEINFFFETNKHATQTEKNPVIEFCRS